MTRVAYVGNFKHAHCTEVALAYGFEQNGCEVLRYQEDRTVPADLWSVPVDLVLYTRTHNVHAIGHEWTGLWRDLEDEGIKTAAVHLDRFWDLERERAIWAKEPMFTVGTLFTADGGNDDRWAEAGVNHVWLPPAIDGRYAHEGLNVRSPVKADVLFVGSTGYHREYPERDNLVRYLKGKYGDRFLHVGYGSRLTGFRLDDLADLIAACKVVVGDSCFANSPRKGRDLSLRYWSDRIPETLGRGGILVHAGVNGLDRQYDLGVEGHLLTHRPGDWQHLTARIDLMLSATDDERRKIGLRAMAHVQAHHTYADRARTVLETLDLRPVQPSLLTHEHVWRCQDCGELREAVENTLDNRTTVR